MARSNFPVAEVETKPDTPRPKLVHEDERPSARPTVPAPSGRYRVAEDAEARREPEVVEDPKPRNLPRLPKFPTEPPVTFTTRRPDLAVTVRPPRRPHGRVAREEYSPRKRDPRAEDE